MSSPTRKSISPNKKRPSTAANTIKVSHTVTNQFQEEINSLIINGQDKDIEIERL